MRVFGRTFVGARRKDSWLILDLLVGVALAVTAIASVVSSPSAGLVVTATGALLGGTVIVRRRSPEVTTIVACICTVAFEQNGGNPNLLVVPIALALNFYMLGRSSSARGWRPVDFLLLGCPPPFIALTPGNASVGAVVSIWLFFMVMPFVLGRVLGTRKEHVRQLQAETVQLAAAQFQGAVRAASEERSRIARELHDVIAHNVSVMVIQVQAARLVAVTNTERSRNALSLVERSGREALADMRRMVGVLHHHDLDLALPGLSQLGVLIDHAKSAGLPVEVRIEGTPQQLSAALDLVAYRTIQEALTNVIKHAGSASATVEIRYAPDALELHICDTGRGAASSNKLNGFSGHGLIGMRERLALYGGDLRIESEPGRGFEVSARLPFTEDMKR